MRVGQLAKKKLLIGGGIVGGVLLGALLLLDKKERQGQRAPNAPANVAERELRRWTGVTEHDPEALPILKEYWAATGQAYPGSPDIPWSGAFVSYVARQSSTPNALLLSGAHVYYARQAYLDRGVPGKYGAYHPTEVHVSPDDIVVRKRAGGDLTFSDLQTSGPMIPSHADVVTAVGPTAARAIGGNMGPPGYSTVKSRLIPHNGGVITDPAVVAVLRYQPPSALS